MKSSYSKIKDRIVYPQSLTPKTIDAIKAWHKSKIKNVVAAIINNPGILTHTLQTEQRFNNIPNAVECANRKLRQLGYVIDCVPNEDNKRQSYRWYLLTLHNGV